MQCNAACACVCVISMSLCVYYLLFFPVIVTSKTEFHNYKKEQVTAAAFDQSCVTSYGISVCPLAGGLGKTSFKAGPGKPMQSQQKPAPQPQAPSAAGGEQTLAEGMGRRGEIAG